MAKRQDSVVARVFAKRDELRAKRDAYVKAFSEGKAEKAVRPGYWRNLRALWCLDRWLDDIKAVR